MILSEIDFDTEYRTGDSDPADGFYRPCIKHSCSYDRASGYFRSSVFSVATREVCEFAKKGGKIRLICSPELKQQDIEAIKESIEKPKTVSINRLTSEIDEMLSDSNLLTPSIILATFLKLGVLELKIAIPIDGVGIYHEKLGIFRDEEGTMVSFKGSLNETYSGWHPNGNFESIEVFCDWVSDPDAHRVKKHAAYFERLWNDEIIDIDVFGIPEAASQNLLKISLNSIEELEACFDQDKDERRKPFRHQSEAIEAWKTNDKRGILKHATGSGKTFTAILILQEFLSEGLPAVILVPSKLLQKQWHDELKQEFPEAAILLVGGFGKGSQLKGQIGSMTDPLQSLGQRIIITIMNTAASDWFLDSVKKSQNLLIIADEVHQLGSGQFSNFFRIDAGARLGLSATPERFGDPEGTQRLFNYFGGIVPPEYTLADAIKDKRLVEYEYYPLPINLTTEEADLWKVETKKIQREYARSKKDKEGNAKVSKRLQMLIINRSRIAKKAHHKIGLCLDVISDNYRKGQRWLIYCEDQYQLAEIMNVLTCKGYSPLEYHSAMNTDKSASLKWFINFGGILVSIKCLDEGVDIPTVSHALILASSQNPRQFIQRRGRVLRKTGGKNLAYIYDSIVVPVNIENEPEQTALLEAELLRAIEFSKTAINSHSGAVLRQLAIDNNLDFSSLFETGIEDNEGE